MKLTLFMLERPTRQCILLIAHLKILFSGGLMLLADVSHRLLRTDNVLEFL